MLTVALDIGLVFGLSYWLVVGLFQGISSEQIEEQSRHVPDQGIQRSLRNCLLMEIITWGVIWLTSILSYGLGGGYAGVWIVFWGDRWSSKSRIEAPELWLAI